MVVPNDNNTIVPILELGYLGFCLQHTGRRSKLTIVRVVMPGGIIIDCLVSERALLYYNKNCRQKYINTPLHGLLLSFEGLHLSRANVLEQKIHLVERYVVCFVTFLLLSPLSFMAWGSG